MIDDNLAADSNKWALLLSGKKNMSKNKELNNITAITSVIKNKDDELGISGIVWNKTSYRAVPGTCK